MTKRAATHVTTASRATKATATGQVICTFDHAGGMPAVERIIRESGIAGAYRHRGAGRRDDLATVQITLGGGGRMWPSGSGVGPGIVIPHGRCLIFRFGQAVVYAPDMSAGHWDFVYANLSGAAALSMIEELVARHGHVLACDPSHPVIVRLIDLAKGSGVSHRRLAVADSARLAAELLLHLADCARPPREAGGGLVEQACSYLVRRIAQQTDIADAARHVGVSREYLTRLFRRQLGATPAHWLHEERLRQADILVRSSHAPISVIARRVGFMGSSHFVQAFRRRYGMTPGRCRSGTTESGATESGTAESSSRTGSHT